MTRYNQPVTVMLCYMRGNTDMVVPFGSWQLAQLYRQAALDFSAVMDVTKRSQGGVCA